MKITRLRKKQKFLKTASSYFLILDSIALKSGDVIEFHVKLINNKPWYQIIHISDYNASSYYDGNNFERAYDLYKEILLAFKGVLVAERLNELKSKFEYEIKQLQQDESFRKTDMHNNLFSNPLFLGISEF